MRTKLLIVEFQVHPVVDLVVFQRDVVLQSTLWKGEPFITQNSVPFFWIHTSVRMLLVAITLKMVYHFFSTILSHLYRDLREHGSQKLKCSRKPISSRILLGASLSGYQFFQVSDCVVLVAFNPHLGIILYDLLTFSHYKWTKEGFHSLSSASIYSPSFPTCHCRWSRSCWRKKSLWKSIRL